LEELQCRFRVSIVIDSLRHAVGGMGTLKTVPAEPIEGERAVVEPATIHE
jgi:hypothetical protein